MQIVPRLATLGRVELMMTRPADVVATDDNFRNYLKSKRRSKMTERSVRVPLDTNVDPFVRAAISSNPDRMLLDLGSQEALSNLRHQLAGSSRSTRPSASSVQT